jgi:sRNA-binding carbon storage regulator CsrA
LSNANVVQINIEAEPKQVEVKKEEPAASVRTSRDENYSQKSEQIGGNDKMVEI